MGNNLQSALTSTQASILDSYAKDTSFPDSPSRFLNLEEYEPKKNDNSHILNSPLAIQCEILKRTFEKFLHPSLHDSQQLQNLESSIPSDKEEIDSSQYVLGSFSNKSFNLKEGESVEREAGQRSIPNDMLTDPVSIMLHRNKLKEHNDYFMSSDCPIEVIQVLREVWQKFFDALVQVSQSLEEEYLSSGQFMAEYGVLLSVIILQNNSWLRKFREKLTDSNQNFSKTQLQETCKPMLDFLQMEFHEEFHAVIEPLRNDSISLYILPGSPDEISGQKAKKTFYLYKTQPNLEEVFMAMYEFFKGNIYPTECLIISPISYTEGMRYLELYSHDSWYRFIADLTEFFQVNRYSPLLEEIAKHRVSQQINQMKKSKQLESKILSRRIKKQEKRAYVKKAKRWEEIKNLDNEAIKEASKRRMRKEQEQRGRN